MLFSDGLLRGPSQSMKPEVYNSGKHPEYCQLYQFACMSSELVLCAAPAFFLPGWCACVMSQCAISGRQPVKSS